MLWQSLKRLGSGLVDLSKEVVTSAAHEATIGLKKAEIFILKTKTELQKTRQNEEQRKSSDNIAR